jgi:hypothetical protein
MPKRTDVGCPAQDASSAAAPSNELPGSVCTPMSRDEGLADEGLLNALSVPLALMSDAFIRRMASFERTAPLSCTFGPASGPRAACRDLSSTANIAGRGLSTRTAGASRSISEAMRLRAAMTASMSTVPVRLPLVSD